MLDTMPMMVSLLATIVINNYRVYWLNCIRMSSPVHFCVCTELAIYIIGLYTF